MTLGQKIKSLREERGWSQEDLESYSGVDRSTIAYLEIGKSRETSVKNYLKFARAFDIHVNELFVAAGHIDVSILHDDNKSPEEILRQIRSLVRKVEIKLKQGSET